MSWNFNDTLTLDYGHGGSDPGASGNGVVEKSANLTTGLSCADELRKHGVKVNETRTTDKDVSLGERVNIANNSKSKYFISIHHNAGGGDRGEYIHSIYRGQGLALAESIGSEMNSKLGQQKKVYQKAGSDNKDYFYVIRNTTMNAVIVEVCFLDNAADIQIADTVEEQKRNGIVIAHGILKHLGIAIKGNTPTPEPEPPTNSNFNCYTVKITADVLNVRKGPGTNYGIATTIRRGEVYTIVGEQVGWGKLKSGAGWISLEYTSRNNNTAPVKTIKVGSRVKITGVNYATGQTIPSWVKNNVYTVQQISGSKALIKEIVSWVYIKDLVLV